MTRRMAVSMTLDAVRDRTKTVTRRRADMWRDLHSGDRLTLIEQGMGLPKGSKQVIVATVEITRMRIEPLGNVTHEEVRREGLIGQAADAVRAGRAETTAAWFLDFWCRGHGYQGLTPEQQAEVPCRRIEWRYLDGELAR